MFALLPCVHIRKAAQPSCDVCPDWRRVGECRVAGIVRIARCELLAMFDMSVLFRAVCDRGCAEPPRRGGSQIATSAHIRQNPLTSPSLPCAPNRLDQFRPDPLAPLRGSLRGGTYPLPDCLSETLPAAHPQRGTARVERLPQLWRNPDTQDNVLHSLNPPIL